MLLRSVLIFATLLFSTAVVSQPTDCVSCHQQAVSDWQSSDHAKAMMVADEASVLGDFSNVSVNHYSQTVRFFKQSDEFYIEYIQDGQAQSFKVSYTFGHYPLQQYLIETSNGRKQVFPYAWDSQPSSQGGQRWYPIYADEDIKEKDRFHWQQPLHNWNGMCANCHSDGLKMQYDPVKDNFESRWDNINVGCQSCHGNMQDHPSQPSADIKNTKIAFTQNEKQKLGQWLLGQDEKVAAWQGPERDNKFMQTCFSCHSLRSPLTGSIEPGEAFLNQFSPTLLALPMYHPDGQIKEEVYVYGSFLQSKMFAARVNCLDCHNKHSMKVKILDNGLCLQCHSAEVYQQPAHLNHSETSVGAQCVSCHMPETTYMGVDARRDHSFRIPRPELTESLSVPNACNNCHQDQTPQWATKNIKTWFKNPTEINAAEQLYIELMHQQTLPLVSHLSLIDDHTLPVIKRATAITLLPMSTQQLFDQQIKRWVISEEPLIRLATAQIGHLLAPEERLKSYSQLLTDPLKAIRVAAVNNLVGMPAHQLKGFNQALAELKESNNVNAWRGEGRLNQSLVNLNLNNPQQAKEDLRKGISIDPYFEPNYINLADIYRGEGKSKEEALILQQGLANNPGSALMHYSKGMQLIRNQQKKQAVNAFKQAMELEPENIQFAYIYFLALDNSGQSREALNQLVEALDKYDNAPQLLQLGYGFAQKLGDQNKMQYLLEKAN